MYADYDIRTSESYPLGTFCKCGCTVHLKESEARDIANIVVCQKCGYEMRLIRSPIDIKIDKD